MPLSLKARHVTEIRRVLDAFLADHGVRDELLIRARREREEITREAFTLAVRGEVEMVLYFLEENFSSLQFTAERSGSPIEFVQISGENAQTGACSLNNIFTLIASDNLPTLDKVMRTLGPEVLPSRSQQSIHSLLHPFPHFQVRAPQFYAECYGGGRNRQVTELFAHFAKRGHVEHKRFKVVYQWGNTLRVDLIEAHRSEVCARFLAIEGIITIWHTQKNFSL